MSLNLIGFIKEQRYNNRYKENEHFPFVPFLKIFILTP